MGSSAKMADFLSCVGNALLWDTTSSEGSRNSVTVAHFPIFARLIFPKPFSFQFSRGFPDVNHGRYSLVCFNFKYLPEGKYPRVATDIGKILFEMIAFQICNSSAKMDCIPTCSIFYIGLQIQSAIILQSSLLCALMDPVRGGGGVNRPCLIPSEA